MKAYQREHKISRNLKVGALLTGVLFVLFCFCTMVSGCTRKSGHTDGRTQNEEVKNENASASSGDTLYMRLAPQLSMADELALKQYSYDELSDTMITMRADTMYVTERNIPRPTPKLLPDTYTLTAEKADGTVYTNEFSFGKGYPGRYAPGKIIEESLFTEEAEKAGVTTAQYLNYYRYMLHSQGYNLTREAELLSAQGELTQDKIFKHPAIDSNYGEVIPGDNAVEKVIVMDPAYRSVHVTGLYLPAGEAVTVTVEGLSQGRRIGIYTGLQNSMAWLSGINTNTISALGCTVKQYSDVNDRYFFNNDIIAAAAAERPSEAIPAIQIHGHLSGVRYANRLPWIRSHFSFTENKTYTIGSPFGGLIHLDPGTSYDNVKITIRGAVETPHYILGVTTPEYFETYLKDAPGVYSVLDTENGQLLGDASYMRNVLSEEVDKLAMLWHTFFSVNETFTGGTFDRKNFVKFDYCVPAGAAVALGNYEYACPASWYNHAMNYQYLLKYGQWGIMHEVGHNHSTAYGVTWGFGDSREGEVLNNALTALAYLKVLDVGTYRDDNGDIAAEHGFVAHPYTNLKYSLTRNISAKQDWIHNDYFEMLSMYVNIMHSFGVEKYFELMSTYKTQSLYVTEATDNTTAKRADFIYRCSLVYGMDFRDYFNRLYQANVRDEVFTDEQLAYMRDLPVYYPVANLYAGGIDGVHTGGDYLVTYGSAPVFDLKGKTVSSGAFTIESVEQPSEGKLTEQGDGTYLYTFGNKPYVRDVFYFTVRTEDGQKHRMEVTLRINNNVSEITRYVKVPSRTLEGAMSDIASLTPTVTATAGGGCAQYTTATDDRNEVRIARFLFRADKSTVHTFYFKADDLAILRAGRDFSHLEEKLRITRDLQSFNETYKFSVTLSEGETYAFEVFNLNAGGGGFATFNLLLDAEEGVSKSVALPAAQVIHPAFEGKEIEPYVFEPKFMVSNKAGLSFGTLSTPKSAWRVLQAPAHHNGDVDTLEMHDPETGETMTMEIDKKSYLIDGQNGTIYHTAYRGTSAGVIDPLPHVFVVDTGDVQGFNFFEIATRNHANSYIRAYNLYISDDNANWRLVSSGADGTDGTPDTWLTYKNAVARLDFEEIRGRYWKLEVLSTSGNNGGAFTVIAELNAGLTAETQHIVPIFNTNIYTTNGWQDSATRETLPVGLLFTETAGEKIKLYFEGDSIALYGNKDNGYGSAEVYIDGEFFGIIDLQSDTLERRRLVFSHGGLTEGGHIVEIVTCSDELFNLGFAGVSYETQLLSALTFQEQEDKIEEQQKQIDAMYDKQAQMQKVQSGLIIAMLVFIGLFLLLTTYIVLTFCLPKFRKAFYENKVIRNYDRDRELAKERKAAQNKTETAKKKSDATSASTAKASAVKSDPVRSAPAAETARKTTQSVRPTSKVSERPATSAQTPRQTPPVRSAGTASKPSAEKSSVPQRTTVASRTTSNSKTDAEKKK